ncbi:glycerophosphoryl diester phosphodiesterase membrane domain-containing protein [bacterium]|nr:glycerophosphoryl diester phosphodiesterase membrane domain-containing protein [bacterium]
MILKDLKNILKYNGKNILLFEFFFKVSSILIISPLFLKLFNLIMKVTGYTYLTLDNIFKFVLNPLTILMILILLLLMTFYSLFDISTIIIMIDASYSKKTISIRNAITLSLKKSLNVFKPKNIGILFLLLFLIPFLNIGLSSNFVNTIKLPEFIQDYIKDNTLLNITYIILLTVLTSILFKWIYSLHYYVLEDIPFNKARKKSVKLGSNNIIKDIVLLLLTQFLVTALFTAVTTLGVAVIYALNNFFSKIGLIASFGITVTSMFLTVLIVIHFLLSTPISYMCISSLFYKHKVDNKEEIKHLNVIEDKEVKRKPWKKLRYYALIIALVTGTIIIRGIEVGDFNLNIEYVKTTEVAGHRGASIYYPENTMLSFRYAKQLGADWVELDVQETKDGQLIVIHDTNLKRTTGVNKNTYDVTYEEIKDLDAGSFLNSSFSDARIPLLEEVVSWAKENNMRLNIEIKPTGHEKDIEKKTVDIITKHNFENLCVIASSQYEVLEKIKNYNSAIQTLYGLSIAYGDLSSFDKADNFSIEASNISDSLVSKVHNEGKEIFAWTVNTEDSINEMINKSVDVIVTNNISLAKELVTQSKTGNVINEIVKFLESILK